jgi:hypothetical protein
MNDQLHPIFKDIVNSFAPALNETPVFPMQYKGYTIKEDYRNPYSNNPDFMFFPTEQGEQHDADGDSEGFYYRGNCKWSPTLEDAMDSIDEIIMQKQPDHQVKTNEGIKNFAWLSEAVRYAIENNGILLTPINSI